jgi:hypothetical protein
MDIKNRSTAAFRRELSLQLAKRYLEERGLAPIAIGRLYAKPYRAPSMSQGEITLQRALLGER